MVNAVFDEGSDQQIRKDLLGFGDKVSEVLTQLSSMLSEDGAIKEEGFNEKLVEIVKSGMKD